MDRKARLAMAAIGLAGLAGYAASNRYEINIMDDFVIPPSWPRKKRRKGRILSDIPFGPPSPFETRQQRRYRERMEAKQQSKMKTVMTNDQP